MSRFGMVGLPLQGLRRIHAFGIGHSPSLLLMLVSDLEGLLHRHLRDQLGSRETIHGILPDGREASKVGWRTKC